jgi:hypothetical protein
MVLPRGSGVLLACVVVWLVVGIRTNASGRAFPDVLGRVGVLIDQLPGDLTDAQIRFAASHFVGTQKLTLDVSSRLRAVNPGFVVLHYRLANWQGAPGVPYIRDGRTWTSDFAEVDPHEDWFWHNPSGQRVASDQDGKLLMNVANPGFRAYWRDSLAEQVAAGDYDGVFLDSASPALLQGEARMPPDPRLAGTGVRTNRLPELGDRTWIEAWQNWIVDLDASLAARKTPLIPNVGQLITTWDTTDYSLTAGVFSEGYLDPAFAESDWREAANRTLDLVRKNRIVILQNYLRTSDDVARRKYLLANYLLMKGARTYVAYFVGGLPLEWYPEWDVELGPPLSSAATVDELARNGVYRRDYSAGTVVVNPSSRTVRVALDRAFRRVDFVGGGSIGPDGVPSGRLAYTRVRTIDLPPTSAEILLHD